MPLLLPYRAAMPCCCLYWGLVLAVLSVSRCTGSCFSSNCPPSPAFSHMGGLGPLPAGERAGRGCMACAVRRRWLARHGIWRAGQREVPKKSQEIPRWVVVASHAAKIGRFAWQQPSQRLGRAPARLPSANHGAGIRNVHNPLVLVDRSRDGVALDPTYPTLDYDSTRQLAPRQTGQEPACLPSRTANRAPLWPAGEAPLPAVGTAGMEPPQRLQPKTRAKERPRGVAAWA